MNKNVTLELGKSAIFTYQSGIEKIITVYGQNQQGQWDIDVNGERSSYSSLQAAIGEPYVSYSYA
jgi:hypothetical protein